MGRILGVLAAGLLALWLAGSAADAASRIGYFDVRKVVARSAAGVAAREELERERAAMEKEFNARKAEVDKLRDELAKKGVLLSEDARREKEETLQRRIRDLRRLSEDYQKEYQRKQTTLENRILQEVSGVIERYGREHGYLLIIERNTGGVAYGDAEADLTEEIIKAYDREKAREKK